MKGLILIFTNILCMIHGTVGIIDLGLFLSENNLMSSSKPSYNPSYYPSSHSTNIKSTIILDSIMSNSYYDSFMFSENSEKMSFHKSSINTIESHSYKYYSNKVSELSFSFDSFTDSENLEHHDDVSYDDDDSYDNIEKYDRFVKVDLDIIGETKATFDIIKQQIFINSVSIIVSVNNKLIWFESINDIVYQNLHLRRLEIQAINAILGVAVNETIANDVVTFFKNSIDDGSLVNYLVNNGLNISMNINDISLVSSPDLTDDDYTTPSLPNPIISDDTDNKNIIIIVCSIVGSAIVIFVIIFMNKIRNRIKPQKTEIPFKSISIDNSLNRYMPYYKKHSPSIINVDNDKN
jgi:hypothetical protein